MKIRILMAATCCVALVGCVPTYTLVQSGAFAVGDLQLVTPVSLNQAPPMHAVTLRKDSALYTHDGRQLDQILVIPGVADGETLIVAPRGVDAALPKFRADMLPNEIEELAESTFVKLFGEGNVVVSTSGLRPHRFGEQPGFMFDIIATITDAPTQNGVVGGFIADDRLYMVVYLAAVPYYFEKHKDAAMAVIESARLPDAG